MRVPRGPSGRERVTAIPERMSPSAQGIIVALVAQDTRAHESAPRAASTLHEPHVLRRGTERVLIDVVRRQVPPDVREFGRVHGAEVADVVHAGQDRVEDGLVPVVEVDLVAEAVESVGHVQGLANHEDVAEDAGCTVKLRRQVRFTRRRLKVGYRVHVYQCRRLGVQGRDVGVDESLCVRIGGDAHVSKEVDVVVGPAQHVSRLSKFAGREQLGWRFGEEVAVDGRQPDVANVVRDITRIGDLGRVEKGIRILGTEAVNHQLAIIVVRGHFAADMIHDSTEGDLGEG